MGSILVLELGEPGADKVDLGAFEDGVDRSEEWIAPIAGSRQLAAISEPVTAQLVPEQLDRFGIPTRMDHAYPLEIKPERKAKEPLEVEGPLLLGELVEEGRMLLALPFGVLTEELPRSIRVLGTPGQGIELVIAKGDQSGTGIDETLDDLKNTSLVRSAIDQVADEDRSAALRRGPGPVDHLVPQCLKQTLKGFGAAVDVSDDVVSRPVVGVSAHGISLSLAFMLSSACDIEIPVIPRVWFARTVTPKWQIGVMDHQTNPHSSKDGWAQIRMGSLAGNLPEMLLRDILAPTKRIIIIEHIDQPLHYVQVLTEKKGRLFVECVSNDFIEDEDEHLSLDDELALMELGFLPPEGIDSTHPNWWWYPTEDGLALEACTKMVRVLEGIFAVRSNDPVWVRQFT